MKMQDVSCNFPLPVDHVEAEISHQGPGSCSTQIGRKKKNKKMKESLLLF